MIADKYRLERVLGLGGMGVVYAARHELLHHDVALKLLLPEVAKDKEAVARFLNEGRATARLQSSHVVRVIDVGLAGTAPFMVMELLAGEDLAQMLEKRGKLQITETVDFLIEAMEGLSHAHAAGIIHRDLKPSNLFLALGDEDVRTLKVVDFGISKTMGSAGANITTTAAVLGSPAYMAPEQLRSSKRVDARADLWSLGVIAYELLTGRLPFDGETVGEIFANILEKPPSPPRSVRQEIPGKLEEAILRCLEKSVEARFHNVAELAGAISRFGTGRCDALVTAIEKKLGAVPNGTAVRAPSTSVPDLELAPVRSANPNAATIAASSSGSVPAAPRSKPSVPMPTTGFGAFDFDDEELAGAKLLTVDEVASPRPARSNPAPLPPPGAVTSQRPRGQRPPAFYASDALRVGVPVIANGFATLLVASLLWRFLATPSGWRVLAIVPSATDGTSIATSSVLAAVFAVACLASALGGLLGRSRRWGLVLGAIGLLVMAIGMLIVVASTTPAGQIGPKPTGAFLVPIGMPLLPVGVMVSVLGAAHERWLDGDRAVSIAMAVAAGGLLYCAIQLFAGAVA